MPEYLAELYLPLGRHGEVEAIVDAANAAAAAVRAEGQPIRCLRFTLVPEDEVCFLWFESASADLVAAVSRRAALRFQSIRQAHEGTVRRMTSHDEPTPDAIEERCEENVR